MSFKNKVAATVAGVGIVFAGFVGTAGSAEAATTIPLATQQAFYKAVNADYYHYTGRTNLYSWAHLMNAGKACYYYINNNKRPFDDAAWVTSGAYFGGNLALARATCAQALRYGIRY